jgi:N-acetylmuramate 1-kinase
MKLHMAASEMNSNGLTEETRRRISAVLRNGPEPSGIVQLAGDASTRAYFRVAYPTGQTVIVMLQAIPGADEEAAFIELHGFLESRGLPVPSILAYSKEESALVLQDLGDELLESVVENARRDDISRFYAEAVDLLVRMRSATELPDPGCRAYSLAFDEEKLMQEMHFFLEHFVVGFARLQPSPAAVKALESFFLTICQTLAREPRIFTHRDFHARNLILHEGRLFMIDFQDARMGPAQYDLASLLRDSYISLPEDLVEGLISRYTDSVGDSDPIRFRYVFDIMSLQRNIKALGTFGYQSWVRNSDRYLSAIPRTGRYIAQNLAKYAEFAAFSRVLEDYIAGPATSTTPS